MKCRLTCLLASVWLLVACQEKKEITVTETRPPNSKDVAPKLFATSDERFRDAKPSPVQGDTPVGWLVLPASQFRLLNYRFGETGMGEVWVSLSNGTVLDNVNRWMKQFAAAPLDQAALAASPRMLVAGSSAYWVSAVGDYAGGMGAPSKPGFALAGVVTSIGGQILTVKMVGPKAEVEAAKPKLEAYIQSLKLSSQ
jgi:hypothetical protein